jgi:ATP-dependent protease ClpP protease subunit
METRIKITGEITGDTLRDFRRRLDAARGDDLLVEIDSVGGAFGASLAMHNDLVAWPGQTTGLVHHAGSAATLPLAACREVIVSPQSTIYVHMPTAQTTRDMRLDAAELRGAATDLEAAANVIAGIYARKTGHSLSWWLGRMQPGVTWKGSGCVACGLADRLDGALTLSMLNKEEEDERERYPMSYYQRRRRFLARERACGRTV